MIPFYAGTRIGEIVGLDIDDVRLSAPDWKTTRVCTGPTDEERTAALDLLDVDE